MYKVIKMYKNYYRIMKGDEIYSRHSDKKQANYICKVLNERNKNERS